MKIAIDTHFITSGSATGNRTYTAELVQSVISIDTQHEFVLYAIERHPYYDQFEANRRVTVRYVLSSNGFVRNYISIPRAVADDRPDIIHLLFIHPILIKTPTVLTVHDLFYVHDNNVGIYNKIIGMLTLKSIKRASMIITISDYSRSDIINHSCINESKIVSIPLGIDAEFKKVDSCDHVKKKLGIDNEYILFVGRTEDPRKNLSNLIMGYAALKKERSIEHKLVIAGRHGHGTRKLINLVEQLGLSNDVLFPGIISKEDLVPLMSGARLFVYISSFEGFGLPVLEAMSCGVPVIASAATSLSEVAGDAALIVNHDDIGEIKNAIKKVLYNNELHSDLSNRGLARAKLYSWEATATATLRVYDDILKK